MGFPCSLFVGLLECKCHFLIKDCSATFLFTKVSVDLFKHSVALEIEETTNLIFKSRQMKSDLGFDDRVKAEHPVLNNSLKAEYRETTNSIHIFYRIEAKLTPGLMGGTTVPTLWH